MLDSSILTDILGAFVNGASQGFSSIRNNAEGLFHKILILELVLFAFGIALNRIDVTRELVGKILAIGFIQFMLFRYVWLVDGIRDGFIEAGLTAAGGKMTGPEFLDPSAFIAMGWDRISAVLKNDVGGNAISFFSAPAPWLINGLVLILMFAAFTAIGLQIFLTVVEFYIISSLAVIFIPFLILQKTSFLGARALNSLLSIGIKLMVIAFVTSLSFPVLEELSFSNNNPTIREYMSLAVGALAVALVMWSAPKIAMSMLFGGGGLDFNSAILQPSLSAANTAGGLGHMAAGAASAGGRAASAVGSAVSGGVRHVRNSVGK